LRREILLGVDAGGTFTDFIAIDLSPPFSVQIHKTLSTPSAPERAILRGIAAMALDRLHEDDTLQIIHGSTVATNAVLEGNLARTAYVANYGLADILSLARQTRSELYALEISQQRIPVPEALCLETGGRLGADGSVVEELGNEELEQLLARLRDLAPESVAVNLLFSFLDDRFEKAISKAIEASGLRVFVSRSSQVLPVYKEYERGIATWLNAALGPVVSGYLNRLLEALPRTPLQIMQSSGETLAAKQAATSAVQLLLSGPAGGLTAIRYLGRQLSEDRIISFDMGGTSTDVALLDGDLQITTEASVAGYPVSVPMVDMHTIGAGGGSIAYVDSGGMLQVGPRSAGAEPGPACYGLGGTQATVTDANLVLGRLLEDSSLAGNLPLQPDLARSALTELGHQLGLSVEATAAGILQIANEHMAQAIRMISVNRGHDPGAYLLASFGGAGGLHVCEIAVAMNINRAIVPVYNGVLSALGMLVANQGRQHSRTLNRVIDASVDAELTEAFEELETVAGSELVAAGLDAAALQVSRNADIRYVGQSYALTVPWQGATRTLRAFIDAHRQRYGYALTGCIEVVNLRVNVYLPRGRIELPRVTGAGELKPCRYTRVWELETAVPVFDRDSIPVEHSECGPAIIREATATTFVAAGWTFRRDEWGNLQLQKLRKQAQVVAGT